MVEERESSAPDLWEACRRRRKARRTPRCCRVCPCFTTRCCCCPRAEQGSHRLTVGCALFVPAQNAHGDLRVRVAELKGRSGGRGPETGHGSAAKQEHAAKAVQAHTRATWGGGTTSSRGSWPSWRIYLGFRCRMERRGAVWWPPLRKEFLPSCLGWEGGPCGAGPVRRRFVGQD